LPKNALAVKLSQTIQFLSNAPVAVTTGLLQVSPPLVERLVSTSEPPLEVRPREEISHTLSCASKATAGSLTCA
jgi:hypothetical protein